MIYLHGLKSLQIVDVSFRLIRHNLFKFFLITCAFVAPIQIVIWIFNVSINDYTSSDLQSRTATLTDILQVFSFLLAFTLASNIFNLHIGRIYCKEVLQGRYAPRPSSVQFQIGIVQVLFQILFVVLLVSLRYIEGRYFTDEQASILSSFSILIIGLLWIFISLRISFAIPISVHEGGTFRQMLKRNRQLNRVHFYRLFSSYIICILILIALLTPASSMISAAISTNFLKSYLSQAAYTGIISTLVTSFVALTFSYILTVTYFNARIEHEGFDIDMAIDQLTREEDINGKLFNSL